MIRENESPVILVIEDDQSISEIVTRVLRQEGCVAHTAFDGAQGLDTFYLTLPDLIILDVKCRLWTAGRLWSGCAGCPGCR